jgi:hypothetical protein
MDKIIRQISLDLGNLNSQHLRLLLIILSLILFVLGAGAPTTPGGFGG